MAVFISYARHDAEAVERLREDIERAKRQVWIDRELTGGQEWWRTILAQIRDCTLFVFALSPDSLRSKACAAELNYALALGRPLLPVMVRDTSVQLAPPAIGNAQIVDYRERSADTAFALVNALVAAPPPPPLPNPLPPEPSVPMSYLNTYREQVEAESLSYHDQVSLFVELRGHLGDDDGHDAAVDLLRRLRARRDVIESVGRDIDDLLSGRRAVETVAATSAPAPGWYPDPKGRYRQRYWDGTNWTDHVSQDGRQFLDRPVASPPSTAPAAPADRPLETGVFVLLLLATVFCAGVVGVIAGAVNLGKPARRGQAQALLITGLVVLAIGVLWFAAVAASNSSSN